MVRSAAFYNRTVLTLAELHRLSTEAIKAGDLGLAAKWLDLRLSVEDPALGRTLRIGWLGTPTSPF